MAVSGWSPFTPRGPKVHLVLGDTSKAGRRVMPTSQGAPLVGFWSPKMELVKAHEYLIYILLYVYIYVHIYIYIYLLYYIYMYYYQNVLDI